MGLPLTFLDAHIRHGNALLGATPELIAKGIPDDAWTPIEGDDKQVAKELKKRHKAGNTPLFGPGAGALVDAPAAAFETEDDGTLDGLSRKERRYREWLAESQDARLIADVWCAAFVWPKQAGEAEQAAPVKGLWNAVRTNPRAIPDSTRRITRELVEQYRFFHWHVEFPEVFHPERGRGGFDVVLGNPPWERVKLQEQEFFAPRDETIATAPNAAARKKLIAKLPEENPALWQEWCAASQEAEGQSFFVRTSGRYPLCGQGDVNTYALFAEHNYSFVSPAGRAGFIVPSGIATDASTQPYFRAVVEQKQLVALQSFENEALLFPGVHHAYKFALVTITGPKRSVKEADLLFFARTTADLSDADRHFVLSVDDFRLINPNTLTCPTFRCRRDAELAKEIHRLHPILWAEDTPDGNPWKVRFSAMFHMANDSGDFLVRETLEEAGWKLIGNTFLRNGQRALPLYEAKLAHHYDHRFATFDGQTEAQANQGKCPELSDEQHADPGLMPLPRYWVSEENVTGRLPSGDEWLAFWRNVTSSVAVRTWVGGVIPRVGAGHSMHILQVGQRPRWGLVANMSSFIFDYCARQKVGGLNFTHGYIKQLPVVLPARYSLPAPWQPGVSLEGWLRPRVLELVYTAWDLRAFAAETGWTGPPFRWSASRRAQLRAEVDAAFFLLYSISREDVSYVMDSFWVVRDNDERAHGEYRTKRVILEIYDELSEAARTGVSYVTRLDPPPADPRVAHPPRPTPSE